MAKRNSAGRGGTALASAFLVAVAACGGRAEIGGGNGGPEDGSAITTLDAALDTAVSADATRDVDATRDAAGEAAHDGARDAAGDALSDAHVHDAAAEAGDATGCNAATCPDGCCGTQGACQVGVGLTACGLAGRACQDCAALGFAACDLTTRDCYFGTPQCNETTCRGCCSDTKCFPGTDVNGCGFGGQACVSCEASSLVCSAAQSCAKPCGPANCSGCCVGETCMPGTDPYACGQGGGQCASCAPVGSTCEASEGGAGRACVPPPCSGITCPLGCCDANGVCQTGGFANTCGENGTACVTCPPGTTCLEGRRCACDPQSCPNGCCSGQVCMPGNADNQCGNGGAQCLDCTGGVPAVSCIAQACDFPPPCNCGDGCCDANGQCQPGASNTACGLAGSYCQDCTQSGGVCDQEGCAVGLDGGVCNQATCPNGCCDSNEQCQQGVTGAACGNFGTLCTNCLSSDQLCTKQLCITPGDAAPPCNPDNCPNGCCDPSGNCYVEGTFDDLSCGTGGTRCLDCTTTGTSCQGGECTALDGDVPCSQSCAGCCDTQGNCQPGFADTECGQVGALCQNCAGQNPASTCDVVGLPRTCASEQTQCPAPYPSCPSVLQENVPPRQHACSPVDLQGAAAACAAGANTLACTTFLSGVNPSCSGCLGTFDYDFVAQVGVSECLSQYLDAECNHWNACVADCMADTCYNCDPSSTAQCEQQAQSSVCAAFVTADQCAAATLAGTGVVCNPATYQGRFGAWLQAVGGVYCAQ